MRSRNKFPWIGLGSLELIGIGGSHLPTPETPPCVRVRARRFEKLRHYSSTNEGGPNDWKWALESPIERALAHGKIPRAEPAAGCTGTVIPIALVKDCLHREKLHGARC